MRTMGIASGSEEARFRCFKSSIYRGSPNCKTALKRGLACVSHDLEIREGQSAVLISQAIYDPISASTWIQTTISVPARMRRNIWPAIVDSTKPSIVPAAPPWAKWS